MPRPINAYVNTNARANANANESILAKQIVSPPTKRENFGQNRDEHGKLCKFPYFILSNSSFIPGYPCFFPPGP